MRLDMAHRSSNPAADDTNKESHSENNTFRVRGVPANWGSEQLQHLIMNQVNGLNMSIKSLATEAGEQYQSATIVFQNLPPQLQNHPNWDIIVPDTSYAEFAAERCLNIDKDFYGLTTLFAPPPRDHKIDIIALSGLGSHAFGSFRQRKGPHMWLRDSLPYDLTSETTNKPMARIMIYGYESDVVNSNNTQNLEDLATAFHNSLLAIATGSTLKPIIFIGHSLGGLIIKQLLICLSRSEFQQDKEFLSAVYGVVFFGSPHDGMDIRALISMAGDGPNRFLLESISRNSQVLSIQQRDFCSALEGQKQSEVFCFYETLESPTAVQDESGRWTNTGPAAILVTKSSATHCRPWEDGPEHICAIARTHSRIVKFGRYDTAYKNVRERMRSLSKRALAVGDQPQEETAKFLVPYTPNPDFINRPKIQNEIKYHFGLGGYEGLSQPRTRVSLCGLGGTGKTQIAIAFAYWLQVTSPNVSIFWVPASDAHHFREAYTSIAEKCNVPGIDDPEANVLLLVKNWLEAQSNSRWLMIVDSADDKELFFPSQREKDIPAMETQLAGEDNGLAQYLPVSNNGWLLFTTRNKQTAVDLCQGGVPIEVPNMTASEAHHLVKAILPGAFSSREIAALSSKLEHLPLALAQAASFIQKSCTTIRDYIERLDKGDSAFIDQLSEAFETVGRDSRTPHAVAANWVISLEKIERDNMLASDILSFLSVLHYQAIPKHLIEHYYLSLRLVENGSSNSFALSNALGYLKAYYVISEGTDQDINMHRLVQLVIQKWLIAKNRMAEYVRRAMMVLSANFPTESYRTFLKYLPHADCVLGKGESNSEAGYVTRASLLRQMILYLSSNGHYNEILQELEEQLLHMTQLRLGREHPNTLERIMHLANVHFRRGRLTEAEILNKRALELKQRVLGNEHPWTLDSIHSLGVLYLHQYRLTEAEFLLCYAFELRTEVLGGGNIHTLDSMGTLANVYRSQRRIEEAENLEKRTLELRSIFLGVNHPRTLMSMQDRARRYCARGQFKMAEDLMLQILELQRGVLRVDHPDIISSMILLANICRDLGKLDVAIRLMESCLSVHKAELGQNHRQTVGLVVVLEKWRREAEICAVNLPRRAWRRRYQSADMCEEEEEEEEEEAEEEEE